MPEQTSRDKMTGLYTGESARELINSSPEGAGVRGLVLIDIDGLRSINRSAGYLTGDQIIQQTADELLRHAQSGDVAARIGGDEFLLFINDVKDPFTVMLRAKSLAGALGPSCCVGAAAGLSPEELYQDASEALSQAKSLRTGSFVFHE